MAAFHIQINFAEYKLKGGPFFSSSVEKGYPPFSISKLLRGKIYAGASHFRG
jgi:hypothetical protein